MSINTTQLSLEWDVDRVETELRHIPVYVQLGARAVREFSLYDHIFKPMIQQPALVAKTVLATPIFCFFSIVNPQITIPLIVGAGLQYMGFDIPSDVL